MLTLIFCILIFFDPWTLFHWFVLSQRVEKVHTLWIHTYFVERETECSEGSRTTR